ncbi:MAG TPA: MaoC family dehydratase [Burkholderiales bacterium]
MRRIEDLGPGTREVTVRTITAEDVDRFAQISGDLNPIHLDAEFAATTPFGRRVAHGLLTGAIVSATHTNLTGPGFVYLGQELNFRAPVHIGDTLTATVTVVEVKAAKRVLVLETVVTNQDGTRVLDGRSALKEMALPRPPRAQ